MKNIYLLSLLLLFGVSVSAQNVGVNEASPANKLSVKGNASVGTDYSQTPGPDNGLIIEGRTGIGTATPGSMLDIQGSFGTAISTLASNSHVNLDTAYSTLVAGTGDTITLPQALAAPRRVYNLIFNASTGADTILVTSGAPVPDTIIFQNTKLVTLLLTGGTMNLQSDGGHYWYASYSTATGTVSSFSSGNLSPLFTTAVANTTSTPALSFSVSNAASYTILGNNTASSAGPTYFSPVLSSALFQNQGTATQVLHGNASGSPTWGQVELTTDVAGTLPISNGGTGGNILPIYLMDTSATGITKTDTLIIVATTATHEYTVAVDINPTTIDVSSTITGTVQWTDNNSAVQKQDFYMQGQTTAGIAIGTVGDASFPIAALRAKTGTNIIVYFTLGVSTATYSISSYVIDMGF